MKDILQTPLEKIMTKKVIAVPRNKPIKEVFQLMEEHGILGIPVVDEKHQVIGIVTERDLTKHFTTLRTPRSIHLLGSLVYLEDLQTFNQHLREHCAETVEGLMQTPVVTMDSSATLLGAINLMAEKKVNRLPVVDPHGKLVGIVTRTDIVHQLAKLNSL